jgi:hypothetical protein
MVGSRCVCGFLIDFDGGYGFSWENSDGFIWVLCLVLGLIAYI